MILMPHDEEGHLLEDQTRTQAWAGRLINLSETGANIHLHAAAVARRGEACTFQLSNGDYELEFSCTIAHFRVYQQYTACGFSFNFQSFEIQKAYMQLLEPVSIGSMLAPVDATKIKQETSGLNKEQYQGVTGASLTVWRSLSQSTIYSFDFKMKAYGVRWSEGMTEVEPYGLSKLNLDGKKTTSPFVHLTTSELEEVRWLFCLAVPNLPKAVPADVRTFLTTLVA